MYILDLDGHRKFFGRTSQYIKVTAFVTFSEGFVAYSNEMLRYTQHDKSDTVEAKGDIILLRE